MTMTSHDFLYGATGKKRDVFCVAFFHWCSGTPLMWAGFGWAARIMRDTGFRGASDSLLKPALRCRRSLRHCAIVPRANDVAVSLMAPSTPSGGAARPVS